MKKLLTILIISFLFPINNAKADTTYVDLDTVSNYQILSFCNLDTIRLFNSSIPNPDGWVPPIGNSYKSCCMIVTKDDFTYSEDNGDTWKTITTNTNGEWRIDNNGGPHPRCYLFFTTEVITPWENNHQAICGDTDTLYASPTNDDNNYQQGVRYIWREKDHSDTIADGYYPNDTSIVVDHTGYYTIEITSGCNSIKDTIYMEITTADPPDLGEDKTFCGEDVSYTINLANDYDTYSWSDGSHENHLYVNAPGTYYVTVNNSCINNLTDSVVIHQYIYPQLELGDDQTICDGSSITLSTFNYTKYGRERWYNTEDGNMLLSIDSFLVVDEEMNIRLKIEIEDCPLMQDTIHIYTKHPYNNTKLCIVTVDPILGKNKIVWGKKEGKGIKSYNIYKETSVENFTLIGNTLFDSLPNFLDTTSFPMSHADRYKVSAIDTCGNESDLSYYHQSIYVSHAESNGTHYIVVSDTYEDEEYSISNGDSGYTPTQYYILEDTTGYGTNFAIIDSMSASYSSYGITHPYPGAIYAIAISKPWAQCESNNDRKTTTVNSKALPNEFVLSNKITVISTGVSYVNIANISIYPNPSGGIFQIRSDKKIKKIEILNNVGQVILLSIHSTTIDLSNYDKGIYFARITTTYGPSIQKIILK